MNAEYIALEIKIFISDSSAQEDFYSKVPQTDEVDRIEVRYIGIPSGKWGNKYCVL